MKEVTIKLYGFDELNEAAQQKAIEKLADVNVDCDWWDCTYEDAERIGLTIDEFDLDRCGYVKAHFVDSARDCADIIIREHGADCDTHRSARQFLADYDALVAKYSDGIHLDEVAEENEYKFDRECDKLECDFLQTMQEEYRIMLQKDYDYQTSREQIIETIRANGYDFTEDGNLY